MANEYLVAYPLTIYLADVETAFPDIDEAENEFSSWTKIGTAGPLDYGDGGTTVTHSQTIETFAGAGSTAPRKAFRTEEGLRLGFTLHDISPEQYAKILDDASITTVAAGAGTAGEKSFEVLRGLNVQQFALLARGQSPVDNALNMQFEWPTVYQSGEVSHAYDKGTPVGAAVEYTALEVTPGEFGTVRIGTAPASS